MDNTNFAYDLLKRFEPTKINDLSLVNASLRPSGESYRDDLISKKVHSNPTEEINDLLKDNYGYLVFQEDTSRFLMEICGFDGGDADNIRRAICAKDIKQFEKIIPEVSEKYCQHSDKPKEQALEEVQEFLQILKDSSRYQFGYNHSTGYSMIGYICAYYRYYHPLEFIASFLNNAKGDDDILNGTTLANEKGITINPPKFGYSSGEYTPDKATNSIYKGIGSIKYCNNTIGQELYDLKDNTYNNFLELLLDIIEKTSCNSRQIGILIKLGFFDKFGKTKYLYDIFEKFQDRYKKTHKDTTKQKRIEEIKEYIETLENKELPIGDIIAAELEYLGYISYIDNSFKKDIMLITQFKKNSYGTPFATLYRLCDGKATNLKINKSFYDKNPIQDLDLIKIVEITKRNKRKKVDGKWTVSDEVEHILSKYSKVVE